MGKNSWEYLRLDVDEAQRGCLNLLGWIHLVEQAEPRIGRASKTGEIDYGFGLSDGSFVILQAHVVTRLPDFLTLSKNVLPSGVLAEQVHPVKGYPLSVSLLTWNHSAFVWAVLLYVEKFHALWGKARTAPR